MRRWRKLERERTVWCTRPETAWQMRPSLWKKFDWKRRMRVFRAQPFEKSHCWRRCTMAISSGRCFCRDSPSSCLSDITLRSFCLCRLQDVVHADRRLYLVFEYLDLDLKKHLDTSPHISQDRMLIKVGIFRVVVTVLLQRTGMVLL